MNRVETVRSDSASAPVSETTSVALTGPDTRQKARYMATVNARELMELYLRGDHDALSQKFIEVLSFFDNNQFWNLTQQLQYFVDVFAENFLYFLTREDYLPSGRYAKLFLQCHPIISNIVAISAFRNTDAHLEILKRQKNNLAKILILFSPRCTTKFDYDALFETNPQLASLWYASYFRSAEGFLTKTVYENMRYHLGYINEKYAYIGIPTSSAYFLATYIDSDGDGHYKRKVNKLLRTVLENVTVRNRPEKKKIAVITARWTPTSAVYKTCFAFIDSLKNDYELTLVQLYHPHDNFDRSLFKDFKFVKIANNKLGLDPILNNDFGLAYYPDIGMQFEERYLANLRIAPIQVTSYGHPVSTFGSEIDYFIGGRDAEIAEDAEKNYSERLVLIPGTAQYPVRPDYTPRNIDKATDRFVINCSWYSHKCNYAHLLNLKKVLEGAKKKLLFRFYSGAALYRINCFLPFKMEMASLLGEENIEVIPDKKYQEYMALMEEGDISVDSYPFGGCNTIIDSLYLGMPVVTREGRKWYNRAASQWLRIVGIEELITTNDEDYVNLMLRLIHEDRYRQHIRDKIRAVDLEEKIFKAQYHEYFKKAIDYLVENHERLKAEGSRKPIIIE